MDLSEIVLMVISLAALCTPSIPFFPPLPPFAQLRLIEPHDFLPFSPKKTAAECIVSWVTLIMSSSTTISWIKLCAPHRSYYLPLGSKNISHLVKQKPSLKKKNLELSVFYKEFFLESCVCLMKILLNIKKCWNKICFSSTKHTGPCG